MNEILDELADPDFTEDDNSETPPSDIVAFNELRSCADLARMTSDGVIDLQPHFQRDIVWSSVEQTKFIDSLVKQLPIPSMCFALDHKNEAWIVIDGLQRMTAIVKFISGGDWKLSNLKDIDPRLAGVIAAAFKTGSGDRKKIFDRVQNKTLPITVLRCDFSKKHHMEYLFTVFHRLNSGGSKLNNQEIRNCIFSGPLNNLLKLFDRNIKWRKLNSMSLKMTEDGFPENNYRYVKQELILRVFAFLDREGHYRGQIAKFLNDYMHDNRNPSPKFVQDKEKLFEDIVTAATRIFPNGPDSKLPTAVMESLLVGLARNIPHVELFTDADMKARFDALRASAPFRVPFGE